MCFPYKVCYKVRPTPNEGVNVINKIENKTEI